MSTAAAENDRTPAMPLGQDAGARAEALPPTAAVAPRAVEALIEATIFGPAEARSRLDRFLAEAVPEKALALWLALFGAPAAAADKELLVQMLNRDVARLDAMIARQLNTILHHPRLQRLEASWRGLRYLVDQLPEDENVKVRVLNVSWQELARDAERALEFDQSQFFHKVYDEEFGMPGGEPFGILLGDYEIHPWPSAAHPLDDLAALEALSQVAAAAFAPLVLGAHPSMFGLDYFSELEQPLNLPRIFQQLDYLKWRAFRDSEDSRFAGLTAPRVLMRCPYTDDGSRVDGFRFSEDVAGPDRDRYLWGTAVWAFGAVVVRAFTDCGWLADIRGVRRGVEGGGLVRGLPVHHFSTGPPGVAPKCSTDVILTDLQEQELSELGLIPLCHCPHTEFSAFYANQSVQKPKKYDEPAATANARVSAMLQYMLCVSRFAHYLKVAHRDKTGAFTDAGECERYLHDWLHRYVTGDAEADLETKAKYPLRAASVQVRDDRGKPGSFLCVVHLWPHFELEELTTSLKLTTKLTSLRL